MDESPDPNKPAPEPPTPEVAQLLRLLELQAATRREPRVPSVLQGSSFRYGSLVVIVIFALGSVAVMEWVISQLPKPRVPAATAAVPAQVQESAPVKSGSPAVSPEGEAPQKN